MKLIMVCFLFIISISALSKEYGKKVTIKSVRPFSDVTTVTGLNNVVRVYFEPVVWGADASCRVTAADLTKSDTHILSVLLMGWASNKNIHIYVDDSIDKLQSDVCRIVNIDVK